ncbi:hypothetical protein [Flavonifractor hominis]|uniref:PABS domain-containing protein n=1 Tax=Flavonifractor hominis TaxID=3133178 RepID=A0ABV1ER59_9FIRM
MKYLPIKLAALFTGIAALMFELIWTRYLGILLGSSTYAVGTVTACYMVGLALGSFLLGALAGRRPMVAALAAMGGFGVLCLLSPLTYRAVRALSVQLGGGLGARVAVSFAALLLPTILVGGMIPALAVLARRRVGEGALYAFHTLGSVLGAGVAGFWTIGTLGLSGSAAVAGGMAILSWGLAGWRRPEPPLPQTAAPAGRTYPVFLRRAAVAVYTISGFTAMAFQMYQTKLLTWFFMDSAYDFAIILMVFLTGSALGNFLFSAVARRETDHTAWLMGSQLLVGVFSVLGVLLAQQLPYWTEHIQRTSQLVPQFGDGAWLMAVLCKAGVAALFLLPVTVLWGGAFPLVSRICRGEEARQGARLGWMLGWNTVGSAAGSLLGSFVMVPLVGWRGSILVNAGLNVLAFLILFAFWQRTAARRRGLCAAAVIPVAMAVLLPEWNRFEMSTSFLAPGQDVEGYVDYLYYQEDAYGVTTVVDFLPSAQKYLITNRLYCQNTSVMGGAEDHRRLGYIPLLLKPDAETMLVTGLGAGITLDGAASRSSVQVDCVEISEAVIEAARCFEEENHGVLDRENVTVIADDARSYVARCEETYDLIVADIFFPMSSGSGNLFSREYYTDCLARLSEDGLMIQWLPLHQFSEQTLEIALNTFAEVFDYAYLWYGLIGDSTPVAGIVGSRQPLELSLEEVEAVYAQEPELAEQLAQTALDDPYMFLSHFIAPVYYDSALPVNTDDRPVLEYLTPRIQQDYAVCGRENLAALTQAKQSTLTCLEDTPALDSVLMEQYDQEIRDFAGLFTQED